MAEQNSFQIVEKTILDIAPAFERVSVDKGIIFAREAEFAIQVVCGSDYMQDIAVKNPQSLRDAVTNISAIGISLNPAKKQAYLVPRKGGITLSISYMGLLDLAIQSGSILWGQAELVYEADRFKLNSYDRAPTHEREPFSKDRGAIVGVYVVVKTVDGDYLTGTMPIDEVWAIRDRSDAWKQYLAKKTKCPWVTDEGEMIKKTIIKRASKTWPKSDRLDKAVHHLNTDGGEGITLADEVSTEHQAEPVKMPKRKSQPQDEIPSADQAEDVTYREVPQSSAKAAPMAAEGFVNPGQIKYLEQKIKALDLSPADVSKMLADNGCVALDISITLTQFDTIKKHLLSL